MKLAIMQPYFFPWIGYFQLISSADRFVVYDDVSYRKGSWIPRNRILMGGREQLFTLPLRGASSNKRIHEVELRDMPRWRRRFLSTLHHAYGKAPHFDETYALAERVVGLETESLGELLRFGLEEVCARLGVATQIVPSSRVYDNDHLKGQERVLDICAREGAGTYINAIGGMALYRVEDFRERGVELRFIRTLPLEYPQGGGDFVPGLSILDVLMWNPPERFREHLASFTLS